MLVRNMFGLIVLGVCGAAVRAMDVPDFIHVCRRNDPGIEECVMRSAQALQPQLKTGVPEYNIPTLEPLVMDELISEHGGGLRITAKNVKVYGASNFKVKDLKLDTDAQRYDMNIELPQLNIEAQYGIDGKILLVPIRGSGPMTANVTDCKGRVVLQGEVYDKNGVKHLRFTSLTIKIAVGGGRGHLYNLFNGDKVLGDVVNDTINKNFDSFLKELLPVIEKSLANVFLRIGNGIVSPFTYDQLFPDQ